MGLTIHYSLRLKSPSRIVARAKLQALNDFAKTLPFADVSTLVSFAGKDADFNNSDRQDEFRWLKIQAEGNFLNKGVLIQVHPAEIIAPGLEKGASRRILVFVAIQQQLKAKARSFQHGWALVGVGRVFARPSTPATSTLLTPFALTS